MKKLLLSCLLVMAGICVHADSAILIYRGTSTYQGDCVATYNEGRLYRGTSTYQGDCFATYSDKKLYRGTSTYQGDCVFTFSSDVGYSPALIAWIAYHYFQVLF